MDNYVITIARQFGSLGRPIGLKMSEILGINYYDRDIVEETAKKMGLPVSEVSEKEETAKVSFFKMQYPLGSGTTIVQDEIFRTQGEIIHSFKEKGPCILVGRCSDYFLRDEMNCINIFIYAPYEVRYKNCIEILRMEPAQAKRMIAKVDAARDAYHKTYAKFLPSDYKYKQLLIDSSVLGVDGTAEYLADFVKRKFYR